MQSPFITVIVPSVRPWLAEEFADSVARNDNPPEVIFLGSKVTEKTAQYPWVKNYVGNECCVFRCALGAHIAQGKYIHFNADDFTFSDNAFDILSKFILDIVDEKRVLVNFRDLEEQPTPDPDKVVFTDITYRHKVFNDDNGSPLFSSAPTLMKSYFHALGGIDKRFVGEQWEKDFCLRAYADGAQNVVCYDASQFGAHYRKHPPGTVTLKHTGSVGYALLDKLWRDEGRRMLPARSSPVESFTAGDFAQCQLSV